MRNKIKYLLVATVVFISFIGCDKPNVNVGETWRYRPGVNKNLFNKTSRLNPFYDFKVIDVKDGYVLYLDLSDSSLESSSVKYFKVAAECIFDCK